MASIITNAIASGYNARVILQQLARRFPQHAAKIEAAEAAGYTADKILQRLDKGRASEDSNDYLTEEEKTTKITKENKRKALIQGVGMLGTAGAVAAGAYGYATRNQAIRPSQILPAQRQQRQLPNQRAPQQLGYSPRPTQPQQQPPQNPQGPIAQRPQQPNPPSPQNGGQGNTFNPPAQRNPERNVTLVRNIKEDTRISNVLQGVG